MWNWNGARWWKLDFHTHTPASDDYGKGANQTMLKNRTYREWLLDYMRAEVDCVVVADHNSGVWIDPLKQELHRMVQERPPGYRELILFPGIEISVNGGIHVLAILDPSKGTADIDTLVGRVDYSGTKGSSDGVTTKSLLEVIDVITKAGGLAIPAHVDEPKGLFESVTGETLRDILQNKDVYAMEIIDRGYKKPGLYQQEKTGWTEVLGSDAHHPVGMGDEKYPGCRYTWVKMGHPGIEGLRLALLDGQLSILRSDEATVNPNMHSSEVIESFEVSRGLYLGQSKTFSLRMNPWLNAIIGGRGTGKSTIVEFMRKCLRRDDELPNAMKDEFEKYNSAREQRNDVGLLTDETQLRVVYRKDDARFRIQWSRSGEMESIEEAHKGSDGMEIWRSAEGAVKQRFPVRVFSQKQIFELAKNQLALLGVIDDAPAVGKQSWNERWNSETGKYLTLRAKAREIEAGLSEEGRLRGELDDVRRKLAVFEKEGHAAVLKEFQIRKRQQRTLTDWEVGWAEMAARLRIVASEIVPDPLHAEGFDLTAAPDKELFQLIEQSRKSLSEIRVAVETQAEKLRLSREDWEKRRDASSWTQTVTKAFQEYEELRKQLEAQNVDDTSAYGSLVQKRQQIEQQLRNLDERKKEVARIQVEGRNVLADIHGLRRVLTASRQAFLSQVIKDNNHIRIELRPYEAVEIVESEFRERTGWAGSVYEKDLGKPEDRTGLLGAIHSDTSTSEAIEKAMGTLRSRLKAIAADPENAQVGDRRFAQKTAALKPEIFDRLDFWFPEDALSVKYSRDGKQFRPIAEGSPGQKTAALLAFILSYGTEPLILDQPEDDLDNHLIYNLIVQQLRAAKRARQIIVVTHNANIVVNGDAELVTALSPGKGETVIECCGSLQEKTVRDSVCEIMEGGSQAFEQRYRRIIQENPHV